MSRKTRILFIDDERVDAEIEEIRSDTAFDVLKCDIFDEAWNKLLDWSPDIVILDLFRGNPANREMPGATVFSTIWSRRFCPLIVYSASPELFDVDKHPFVSKVQKGIEGPTKLKTAISQCQPFVDAVLQAETYVKEQYAVVLKEIVPFVFESFTNGTEQNEAILRLGRRRLASFFDTDMRPDTTLSCWEEYV